jgi:hypothetical protein
MTRLSYRNVTDFAPPGVQSEPQDEIIHAGGRFFASQPRVTGAIRSRNCIGKGGQGDRGSPVKCPRVLDRQRFYRSFGSQPESVFCSEWIAGQLQRGSCKTPSVGTALRAVRGRFGETSKKRGDGSLTRPRCARRMSKLRGRFGETSLPGIANAWVLQEPHKKEKTSCETEERGLVYS